VQQLLCKGVLQRAIPIVRDAAQPGYPEAMEEVDADAWIDHENAADYVVVESSVKVTADLVLTVLWWKNQTQILELED
jgi:hypothetical protein